MLHEYTHLLGFHISNEVINFKGIITKRSDGYYLEKKIDPFTGQDFLLLIRDYFNWDSIEEIKLELDEDGNIHWPSRLFLGDYMANIYYPEETIFSDFTLEFLRLLGYLGTLGYSGGLMKFGFKKGCTFFNMPCGAGDFENNGNELYKYIFGNEFYLPNETNKFPEPSCTSGRLSKTVYKLNPIDKDNEGSEEVYEFYLNGYDGPKSTNYCPIAEFYTPPNGSQNKYYTGSCSDPSTLIDINYKEELGNNFFCF